MTYNKENLRMWMRITAAVMLYGLLSSRWEQNGAALWLCAAGLPCLLALLYALSVHWGDAGDYHFRGCDRVGQAIRLSLPLLVFPAVNAVFAALSPESISGETVSPAQILMTLTAALAEEALFRGALPAAIRRSTGSSRLRSFILASVVFACIHAVNRQAGMGGADVAAQIAAAFFLGFTLGVLTEMTGSILPGTVLHGLINLSSPARSATLSLTKTERWTWLAVSAVFFMIYLLLFLRREREGQNI